MTADPRIRIKCRNCGSTEVVRDAWASWNEELQMWELNDLYDHAYCNSCDSETKLKEEEIEQ